MSKSRFAVGVCFFICGFIYTNWSTRLPHIQDIFSLSNSSLGLLLFCVAVGSLCSMPLTGWLISKRGSKWATKITLLSFCLVTMLIPLLTQVWQVGVVFYLLGFFLGGLDVSMNSHAVLVEQQLGKPIMSSFHALYSVGMMLGAMSGSAFTKYFEGLSVHFFSISIVSFIVALLLIPYLINDEGKQEESHGSFFVLPNKAVLLLGIIAFCAFLAEGAMADWSTNYVRNYIKTDDYIAPLALSIFSGTMTIGRFLGDKMRIYLGDAKLLLWGATTATIGLAFGLSYLSYWVFFIGVFFVGFGLSTLVPIAFSQAGNVKNVPQGMGLAMVTTLGYLGLLVGPPVIGFIADWQNMRIALWFVVSLLVVLTWLSRLASYYEENAPHPLPPLHNERGEIS